MRAIARILFALAAVAPLTACDPAGEDRILSIEATAAVTGVVFVDVNGTGALEAQDTAARVPVALIRFGTVDTVARTTTGSTGIFNFLDVPVGRYEVAVLNSALGDSLQVVFVEQPEGGPDADSTIVELALGDTAGLTIGVGFPTLSIVEARAAAPGRKVFVRAVSQTFRDEFGDTSLYVRDDDAAIRVARILSPNVFPGDTVNVLGITGSRAGQPVLVNVATFVLAVGSSPDPVEVSPADVPGALGGALDATLVSVADLTVEDTTRIDADDLILHTFYGGTAIDVLVHQDGSFDFADYPELSMIDVIGILVPASAGGDWRIQPRSADDITVTP